MKKPPQGGFFIGGESSLTRSDKNTRMAAFSLAERVLSRDPIKTPVRRLFHLAERELSHRTEKTSRKRLFDLAERELSQLIIFDESIDICLISS